MPNTRNVSNRELLDLARAWVTSNYPGSTLEYISLRCSYLPHEVVLASGSCAQAESREMPNSSCNEHEDEPLPLCVQEILQTLRDVGKKLSLTRLKEEMDRRGRGFSRSTLAHYCAELVQDGTLLNPDDLQPRGYSLPEWAEDG